ncbi:RNA polymerase subunit sigma-70 [Methylobacterium sp. Leaf456]|uniref:sigma-70 family RNA polymerase sigma factor n=1 Tax=Methylobacterium sp. Leaf456 TaxID=1736382 RepID=UPI0006FD23E4|nr:sigma-70 family RNA polymerase sigma factor [Methylobacterium sp. Leaf456]KQT45469.1 RNA polymerase subunit sigma-70 [Methylobacterium sp. Leaf456]
MTDEPTHADREDLPEADRQNATKAVPGHLALALRDYFDVAAQAPLPDRLGELMGRFEAALASLGGRMETVFRDDLVRALPMLRTFAISLTANPSRADDLVQETMVKAWANRERFTPGTNFTAWLFTILRNQFYTEIRKGRREVEDADGVHAGTLTTQADQEHAAGLRMVMNLIGTLPLPQRQALLLVGAEGFTYEEAAERLGCQVGTVKSRVSRARAFLSESFEGLPTGLATARA